MEHQRTQHPEHDRTPDVRKKNDHGTHAQGHHRPGSSGDSGPVAEHPAHPEHNTPNDRPADRPADWARQRNPDDLAEPDPQPAEADWHAKHQQHKQKQKPEADPKADPKAVAQQGVAGSGGQLPHLEPIQAAFGDFDVTGVQAHGDGPARDASEALGAEAYATGNDVAFSKAPTLHTAAHEAAHVIQQRTGVSLKGGMGEVGDPYEQHADAVADAVVQGRSAEALLAAFTGNGRDTAVQRQGKTLEVEPDMPSPRDTDDDATEAPESSKPAPLAPEVRERMSEELQKCIDEMGGHPAYLPAGIATPEELAALREQCTHRVELLAVEVTIVDDSDIVGFFAAATRFGEVRMTSVETMVQNVLRAANNRPISRLNVLDHGNPNSIQMGSDQISMQTLPAHREQLSALRGHFASGGFVHLQHCKLGQNHPLLKELSKVLGAPVTAGTGKHNPVYRFNFGDYVRCDPQGCRAAERP